MNTSDLPSPQNESIILFPSASRTATISSSSQSNLFYKGVHLVLDITVVPGVQTITVDVEGIDPISGLSYSLLTSAAFVATGLQNPLTVYPGITVVANEQSSIILPINWRATVTHSGAGAFTYSLSANLIL